ncbi:MAG: response regulator transcription factor [Bacteroidetes bacterium]|nr:response regulator transcription factor [Bacteroidota bacterium]MBS1739783.1 response regulator transcription factor [Bacteroidota bacterium]
MNTIKYLICDDHKIFRQGLKLALLDDSNLELVGEASNGLELLKQWKQCKPDVILLDIQMPEMDGAETIKQLRAEDAEVKIIIISMFEDERFVMHFMEAGANGFLSKNAEPEEIKDAIYAVCTHGIYFNNRVSGSLLRNVAIKRSKPLPINIQLNEREIQVLELICKEYTTAEIGKEIFLSTRTVEGIRSALIEKFGVRNTAGLVIYAIRYGIVY